MSRRRRSRRRLIREGSPETSAVAGQPPAAREGEDDPELKRTRLYPLWPGGKVEEVYGAPRSREEARREELECLNAEYLCEKGDIPGLIDHHLAILDQRPNDLATLYYLGRTYLTHGEPARVIALIGEAHGRYPRLLDFQELLLEALFALGRTEADFAWATEIRVFRLDQSVLDACHEYLKRKRKPRYADELKALFSREGCCAFSGAELVEALAGDDRFIVADCGVRRRRKREGRGTLARVGSGGVKGACSRCHTNRAGVGTSASGLGGSDHG